MEPLKVDQLYIQTLDGEHIATVVGYRSAHGDKQAEYERDRMRAEYMVDASNQHAQLTSALATSKADAKSAHFRAGQAIGIIQKLVTAVDGKTPCPICGGNEHQPLCSLIQAKAFIK